MAKGLEIITTNCLELISDEISYDIIINVDVETGRTVDNDLNSYATTFKSAEPAQPKKEKENDGRGVLKALWLKVEQILNIYFYHQHKEKAFRVEKLDCKINMS